MSTQSVANDQSTECRHPGCDTVGKRWEMHHGRFCSNRCEVKKDGRDVLADYRLDHTLCFTCFRRQKTIMPPKPDFEFTERGHGWAYDENGEPELVFYSQEITRQAATGRQFLTEHATKGEKQRGEHVVTGTICQACGTTDHKHHEPFVDDRAAIGRLATLLLEDDDVEVDVEALHREYAATRDIELAVGRAADGQEADDGGRG